MKKRRRTKGTELIPREKARKVLYYETRGKKARIAKERPGVATIVIGILAVICLLYCMSIYFITGYGSKFFLIWGVFAVALGGLSVLLSHEKWLQAIPGWIRVGFVVMCVLGGLLVTVMSCLVFGKWHAKPTGEADYLVVLGAQWKNNGPSYTLKKRLDKALEYLEEHPDTYVVVTGGQGANEPISEAQGMGRYLEERGIAPERIRVEDTSATTYENLRNSEQFLDKEQDRVVIVTNNFHMFRALRIARKQGYANVEGLAAPAHPGLFLNNLLREDLSIVKNLLLGRL